MEIHFDLEKLSGYLDGVLAADEEERIKIHLLTCEACAADLGRLRMTVAALKELPTVEMSPQAGARLMARLGLNREEAPPVLRPWWSRLSLAALVPAAALVLALAFIIVNLNTPRQMDMMSKAPAKAPVIIAEFSSQGNEERSLSRSPVAPTSEAPGGTISSDKSAAAPSKDLYAAPEAEMTLPLVVIGTRDYEPPAVISLLSARFKQPIDDLEQQRLLIETAGGEGDSLADALSAVRNRQPESALLYAELARFQGKRVWIIVTEEEGQRRALVVRAKTDDR